MKTILRILMVELLIVGLLGMSPIDIFTKLNTNKSYPDIAVLEKQTFENVNKYRQSKGLVALQWQEDVFTEAKKHGKAMASKNKLSHDGFQNRCDVLMKKINGMAGAAENVAMGNLTPKGVTEGWIHSDGHRKNMEGDYNYTAIGIVQDKKGILWFTQIFLKINQ